MNDGVESGPVLWRLVRSVLNPTRLRMLRLICETDGTLCVREICRALKLDDPVGCIYLKQMNAQGILDAARHEVKVYYRPWRDCPWTAPTRFRDSLVSYWERGVPDGWEVDLMTRLRAFSHFNRLAMLARLSRGEAGMRDLKCAVGTCVKTIEHHLSFLTSADLLETKHRGDSGYCFQLHQPGHPVSATLMSILDENVRAGIDYRNVVEDHALDTASRAVIRRIVSREDNLRGGWILKKKMRPVQHVPTSRERTALMEEDDGLFEEGRV